MSSKTGGKGERRKRAANSGNVDGRTNPKSMRPAAVDHSDKSSAILPPTPTLTTLPIEIWEKIVLSAADGDGDERALKLSTIIRMSQISRRYWHARKNAKFFTSIDMASGFSTAHEEDVFNAYAPSINAHTKLVKFGSISHLDYIAKIKKLFAANGSSIQRVHFIGDMEKKCTAWPQLFLCIMSLGRLTHLHMENYVIDAETRSTSIVKIFTRPQAVDLVSVKIVKCEFVKNRSGFDRRPFDDFTKYKCANLEELVVMDSNARLDLRSTIMRTRMPKLRILRFVDIDFIRIYSPKFNHMTVHTGEPLSWRCVELSADWIYDKRHEFYSLAEEFVNVERFLLGSQGHYQIGLNVQCIFSSCPLIKHFSVQYSGVTTCGCKKETFVPWMLNLETVNLTSMTITNVDNVLDLINADDDNQPPLTAVDLSCSQCTVGKLVAMLKKYASTLATVDLSENVSVPIAQRRLHRGPIEIDTMRRAIEE